MIKQGLSVVDSYTCVIWDIWTGVVHLKTLYIKLYKWIFNIDSFRNLLFARSRRATIIDFTLLALV